MISNYIKSIFALLLLALPLLSNAQEKGRRISQGELVTYTEIDPSYGNLVTPADNGEYIDNNTEDAYLSIRVKAQAKANKEILAPEVEKLRVEEMKTKSVPLPRLRVSGDEMFDISNYKEDIKQWQKNYPDAVQFVDNETRLLIMSGNYAGLYKKALVNDYIAKK